MAVIKYGSIVTGGSGSLGGSTLQPCHSGNIWRNKPQQTYSRTPAQALIRGYNKTMQAGWRALTDQDRKVWNNFAQLHPVCNRAGEKHPLSGHSLWMKYQFEYISRGAPFLSDPALMGPPYLGPELVSDPYFQNPALWNICAPWYILNGHAIRPFGATTNIALISPGVTLELGASYLISTFFHVFAIACRFYLDAVTPRVIGGIGSQTFVTTALYTSAYFGIRSDRAQNISLYSIKRNYI